MALLELKDVSKGDDKLNLLIEGEHKKINNVSIRPILNVKWGDDTRKIVAIGINPSNAGKENNLSDSTVTKLSKFLNMYGFTNFTMINLFECVSPNNIPDYSRKTNFENHSDLFNSADMILIVWGVNSKNKLVKAQKEAVLKILEKKYKEKLYCIKDKNFPRHPSRINYENAEIISW